MFTQEEFAAEVARQFQFLEADYGMRREPMHSERGRSWVGFANTGVKVVVELEDGAYISVTVQNLRHVKHDTLERSEFDLDEIVAASSPRPPRRQDLRASREGVARAAETLRTLGAPVLGGAFDTLHARQLKAVETLRRHDNPPLQNEPENGKSRS
jgi:hypothetical protein